MISNKWSNTTSQTPRKTRTIKTQIKKKERRREIINIRAEINEIKTKKHIKNQQTESQFFEKIKKIDKTQANLTKMRREKTQISRIRNAKGR
jgi:hypothetical protein